MTTLRTAAVAAAAFALAAAAAAPAGRAEPATDADAASPWVTLHASRARLVAGKADAAGGGRLAGLEIEMADGWKTYWRMPGDAGVPPTFDWSGSANAASSPKVLYPAPMRMAEAGGEVIGYKRAVLFPIEVTPQDLTKPVALKLALEFGICRDICVPATAKFELVLPPATKGGGSGTLVADAIDRVPRPQAQRRPRDPELKQVTVGTGGSGGVRLTVAAAFHGAKGADALIEAPEGLYVPLPRKEAQSETQAPDGVIRFGVDLSADLARDLKGKTLTVTLVSESGASEAQWTVP
jgi:DsbC/DsbD-like thiol-disulfide interchange protein